MPIPASTLRRIPPAAAISGGLAAFLLFAAAAWATTGPGRYWDFDRLALAGSAALLGHLWARAFLWLTALFGILAVGLGILLGLACVVQGVRTRRLPRTLGSAMLLFGGANLATQALKGLLPRAVGVWGVPFGLAVGFPSGHATLAISLALALLFLAPGRWRPWIAPGVGAGAALVDYSLLRMGFHAPGEILGAVLLTTALAFLVLGFLPRKREEGSPSGAAGGWRRLPAWLTAGVGLGWVASGLLAFRLLSSAPPGPVEAMVAYEAGWRLIAGAPMLAVGLVALLLVEPGRRVGVGAAGAAISLVLLFVLADGLGLRAEARAQGRGPRRCLEEQLHRLAWLDHAADQLHCTNIRAQWALGREARKWDFLAELPHRFRALDQDFRDFAARPMDAGEREAFARVEADWLELRSALSAVAEEIRARRGPGPLPEPERLRQRRARMEESLRALRHLVRQQALPFWEAQGETERPVVLGRPRPKG